MEQKVHDMNPARPCVPFFQLRHSSSLCGLAHPPGPSILLRAAGAAGNPVGSRRDSHLDRRQRQLEHARELEHGRPPGNQ